MKFLFENESFSFEALRTAGYASYGGADLGEVLVTARGIPDGDQALWHRRWKALAERLHAVGTSALQAGHRVSARDALLRRGHLFSFAGPAALPSAAEFAATLGSPPAWQSHSPGTTRRPPPLPVPAGTSGGPVTSPPATTRSPRSPPPASASQAQP